MRIPVAEFTAESIYEAMDDYGFEGELIYHEGEAKGELRVTGGTYTFVCHPESNEIEIEDLSINIDGFIDEQDI